MAKKADKSETKEKYVKKNVQLQVEEYFSTNYDFRRNVIAKRIEYKKKSDTDWLEADENVLWRELALLGYKYSIGNIIQLLKSDFVVDFNPIEDYFENLPEWDGGEYIYELSKYIEVKPATDHERFFRMFTKWLVRLIRHGLGGGVNKESIIFTGAQDKGKTSFFHFLLPKQLQEYFKENPDTDSKNRDGKIALTRALIVNFDEMDSMGKKDMAQVKSYMTKAICDDRLPYAKTEGRFPTIASFVGSTNKKQFLYDETGNVRFISFELDRIIFDKTDPTKPNYRNIDIDKVWAQAYMLYKDKSFVCDLTPEETKLNEEINKAFLVRTEEMEVISITMHIPKEGDESEFLSALEIKNKLRQLGYMNLDHQRIGKALSAFGYNYHNGRSDTNKQPHYGYDVVFDQKL
ncbi:MAG: virulence-associated E family protein [Bacteroidales bacterium]|nr:virulence-associated E family protein [Bacteroidales bacterium]